MHDGKICATLSILKTLLTHFLNMADTGSAASGKVWHTQQSDPTLLSDLEIKVRICMSSNYIAIAFIVL